MAFPKIGNLAPAFSLKNQDGKTVSLKDFKGKQATSVAETFDPSQANIDKRTVRTTVGGVKLALLTRKTAARPSISICRCTSATRKACSASALWRNWREPCWRAAPAATAASSWPTNSTS